VGGAQLRPRVGPAALAAQASPSLSSARDRAWIPGPQSVWLMLVASASRSSAPAATRVCPVLLAASISSGSAHTETNNSGACSLACRASSRALS